ncbi:MAG: hypothetical protein DDT31_01892 [Syntrophomonadaceae bacterium]|nr:hypothetical protein [Bacillota bacterium]
MGFPELLLLYIKVESSLPNSSNWRLSFASDINLLCASRDDILSFYDTFGAVSYEITLPTDWSPIEGAVLGTRGELYVVSFDSDTFESFIRRVTLE